MSPSWKWKLLTIVATILLSGYLLVPTLFHFDQQREQALAEDLPLPWYFHLFPDRGVRLGLDLQGGIYVELEVEVAEAIANQLYTLQKEISGVFKDKAITPVSIDQPKGTDQIVVQLKSESEVATLRTWLQKQRNGVLVSKTDESDPKRLRLTMDERYRDNLSDKIIANAVESVRNRIDRYGVAEPNILRQGKDRIVVELPGIKDPERALKVIQQAGRLEFKMVDESKTTTDLVTLIAEVKKAHTLPDALYSEEATPQLNTLLADKLSPESEIAFEVQRDAVTRKITNVTPILLKRKVEVSGETLKSAVVDVQNNEPFVSIAFDPTGTKLFGEVTKANVDKRLAILLDGLVQSTPVIQEPILGGQARITLGFGSYESLYREAEDLTLVLQEGALPARLKEATKTVIGPTLGRDSIEKGLRSILIGGAIVVVFMMIYYKLSGGLASLALLLNLVFIFALLAMFQATLTLPGLAGIALTIGMAVDANVLIYERIREELRKGKAARTAIESGYQNAMSAIWDGNITTFIAGLVLYQFGTGPIRGFAVTLMMGIASSMFTAIVMTKVVFDYLTIRRRIERVSV